MDFPAKKCRVTCAACIGGETSSYISTSEVQRDSNNGRVQTTPDSKKQHRYHLSRDRDTDASCGADHQRRRRPKRKEGRASSQLTSQPKEVGQLYINAANHRLTE